MNETLHSLFFKATPAGLAVMDEHLRFVCINDALAKIQNGTYGICEGTGKPISRARLEAQPWARYSIEYARKIETHGR